MNFSVEENSIRDFKICINASSQKSSSTEMFVDRNFLPKTGIEMTPKVRNLYILKCIVLLFEPLNFNLDAHIVNSVESSHFTFTRLDKRRSTNLNRYFWLRICLTYRQLHLNDYDYYFFIRYNLCNYYIMPKCSYCSFSSTLAMVIHHMKCLHRFVPSMSLCWLSRRKKVQ